MNGFTVIPRWTKEPAPGVGAHDASIPETETALLTRAATHLGVPLSSVLLAAHAKALSALSGENEVWTGYGVSDGPPIQIRLGLRQSSWRDLVLETAHAQSELLRRRFVPEPGSGVGKKITQPTFETVFEMGDGRRGLDPGTVLRVSFAQHDRLVLRLRYRLDVMDAECAARIAGYHLRALSLLSADLDNEHEAVSLLSLEELRHQIHGLAGPQRDLPDLRVHEIFEGHARTRPEAIAASFKDKQLTYGELNARANRLARALASRGIRPEEVVGVVTERNLDWMSAQLAIWKSGGAYLPIEPQFPADRIARMLSRADCRLVLTEPGSDSSLNKALAATSGVESLFIDEAFREEHQDDDLRIPVGPDRLAYIYFTSGSTGEPKGVMGEHEGMLNHVMAKIEDLDIREGAVVAETAPQCFDISLWQILSPLLAGGRSLIVEQELILDAARFIDKIIESRVSVMQVVPSYLEVLVSYLARHPRKFPDLLRVSATGEALKKELVQRWFAVQPGIPLVNTYGLTETSDDTNHETMEKVPERDRVPLGRPISNVHVYVVDERLSPVPLGAPGEIVFSGMCVTRGYINDPERTERAFFPDPHRPGQRLYRGGDFGRWLPDGKLEYLGRRDNQVKIDGHRIEIGEIENRLLQLPGVREGAVVAAERAGGGSQLAAFYTGDRLNIEVIRNLLGESLPKYMIPSAFHWRQTLPLTGSGKIDKKPLKALAAEFELTGQTREEPDTGTERWLAALWAEVLGIPADRISRSDHFFDLGGNSLSAVRLAIALDRAVSFKDINAHPILAEQAKLIERRRSLPSGRVAVPVRECGTSVTTARRTTERRVPG